MKKSKEDEEMETKKKTIESLIYRIESDMRNLQRKVRLLKSILNSEGR
ncbi:MAG: hypothetical protein J7J52_04735 [Deltaproteobacteria bacterium]|nr:hypothetical protein [Deltaproteobacteria bacterium]